MAKKEKRKPTEKHVIGMWPQCQRWLIFDHPSYEQNSSYLANFN